MATRKDTDRADKTVDTGLEPGVQAVEHPTSAPNTPQGQSDADWQGVTSAQTNAAQNAASNDANANLVTERGSEDRSE